MDSLTANEHSFITMMGESDEHARKGFELILKLPSFAKYFDTLVEKGFFDPVHNPAPVRVDEQGYFQIPYWKALDYLVACAKWTGSEDNSDLANKIMGIVRSVSATSASSDSGENYHTYRVFAEIIGLLPIDSVSTKDVDLVQGWLNTRFDRSLVVHALDEGVLHRFLSSEDSAAWDKAVQLVGYCTQIAWRHTKYGADTEEPVTVVDEYWLKELVDHHASSFGRKVGHGAATLFSDRVREVFGRGGRSKWSQVFRAAVEEDGQNPQGNSAEDCVVVGLREVLLAWCDGDPPAAKPFVHSLLREENEMLRRIGIYVLGQRWKDLSELYYPIAIPELFKSGHLHELYGLLRDNFERFSNQERAATIRAIRNLPEPKEDTSGIRERNQHRWLSALAGTAYEPAAEWLAELTKKFRGDPGHSEYLSFTETRWGPGPSHYSVQELISFATERSIGERLSTVKQGDMWEGPTVEALVDELERAVGSVPEKFVHVLPDFLAVPRPYQYGLINGYLKLWREPKESVASTDWNGIWSPLFRFFKQLLADSQFWNIGDTDWREVQPSRVANAIADLLDYGTRDDQHAYPADLLPDGWSLIRILVENGEPVTEPSHDPMNQAINSSRGRALEAAFSHILRRCRLADKEIGSHAEVWPEVCGFVTQELARCVGSNFEFSTLCGAYLGNLEYMDASWLTKNIRDIFPVAHPTNLRCAVGGLAYASISRRIYQMLRDTEVMDSALRLEHQGRHSREKLMERLMLGYLWGEETLHAPRFAYLFRSGHSEDFELINLFFRGIRRETLNPEQVERIVNYWHHCVKWAQKQTKPPTNLLAGLSGLTAFLKTAKGSRDLLLAVAPYVRVHHESYEFIFELNRLVGDSPAEVRDILASFIDTHEPFYDYEGRMQTLLRSLAELGCREDVIDFCNKLRSMAGMDTLYNELTT